MGSVANIHQTVNAEIGEVLGRLQKNTRGRKICSALVPFYQTIKLKNAAKQAAIILGTYEAKGSSHEHWQQEGENQLEAKINSLTNLRNRIKKSHFVKKKHRFKLEQRIIALETRILRPLSEGVESRKDDNPQTKKLSENLLQRAQNYKNNTFSIVEKKLSKQEEAMIGDLVIQHRRFAELLTENPKIRDKFFEWCLLNALDKDLFIKYATITEIIPAVALSHIATACPSELYEAEEAITDDGIEVKYLRMQAHVVDNDGNPSYVHINLLDQEAPSPFDSSATVGKLFKDFATASCGDRHHQFFQDGLHARNTGNAAIDCTAANWWDRLPVFKTLSLEQAQERYGAGVNGTDWVVSPRATYTSEELSGKENHSYLEVAIPFQNGTDKDYRVYPFGKDPYKDPISNFQILRFVAKTTEARIVYADQGAYYTERKNQGVAFLVTKAQGEGVMEKIKQDINAGLNHELNFQLIGENCACWAQEVVDELWTAAKPHDQPPILFETAFREMNPLLSSGLISRGTFAFLGAGRSKRIGDEKKSLRKNPAFLNGNFSLPTKLAHNLDNDRVTPFYDLTEKPASTEEPAAV